MVQRSIQIELLETFQDWLMTVAPIASAGASVDPWLSSVLGRPAWKIDANQPEAIASVSRFDAGPAFFFTRIATSDVRTLKRLQDADFRVVDTTVTLEAPRLIIPEAVAKDIRFAAPADQAVVAAIASNSFETSRLHLDPAIPTALANRSRAEWASNYFQGLRGDTMVVAETAGKVAGFLQLLGPTAGVLTIDLIAVRESSRRLGLGAACISFAAKNVVGTERLRVGTQVANIGSLRFYENLGFSVTATEYVLHLHRT
jgi:ribosomal protein S18 acetylase RimI-like enzyme